MGIYEASPEAKQYRNWEILKNRHAQYIYTRITETVSDEDNRLELLKYVRRFGNPSRKIVQMLSGVHSRPVCRTTDKDALDRTFWKHVDAASLRRAGQNAEYYAEGMGDCFVYIYKDPKKKKVQFKIYPCHQVKAEWDEAGEIKTATVTTANGEMLIDYVANTMKIGDAAPKKMEYNPLIHYRLDETAPGWSVDIVEPIFDVTVEIGNQICLFLESGYLRAHEQLAVDTGAGGDVSPGDVGEVVLGSRQILGFPIKAVPLVSADTAEKFFESIQNLAIFAAEQEGIPEGYFNQQNYQGYPPLLRDRWEISCSKWREKDLECLTEAGKLVKSSGVDWDPEIEWMIFYQEPRGMITREDQLRNLKEEISLGLNNPAWFAFSTDDFETYQDAKDWVKLNVAFDNEFNEAKAARNMSLQANANPANSPTPQQNGQAGGVLSAQIKAGALDDDYDGNAGPSMIPRNSLPK